MGGFTFCCGDFVAAMDAKGTVTNEILEMIEEDERVCYINSDSTVGRVAEAMKKYPDRVLDTGIQEMNMVTVAAGLAKMGYIPFVQTFGPFLCVRALDQIHNDVCYNDFPVRLIGTHAGLSSGYGPTHNTIIATGMAVFNSVQAALKLQEQGYDIGVIDMHTIKPIDKEAVIKAAKATGKILTVEDHNVLGGLGARVADVLMEEGVPAQLKKIGVPDCFAEFGYPEELYPYYGLDVDGIVKTDLNSNNNSVEFLMVQPSFLIDRR